MTASWLSRIVLFLVALSFLAWGIGDYYLRTDSGSQTVAQVGKTKINMETYLSFYKQQMNMLAEKGKAPLSPEIAKEIGLPAHVLDLLVTSALFDEKTGSLGLSLPEGFLLEKISREPAFLTQDGKFERQRLEQMMKQKALRIEDFLDHQRRFALRQQLIGSLSEGIHTPDTFIKAFLEFQQETRSIHYMTLALSSLPEKKRAPEETALKKWFKENRTSYDLHELRKIGFIKIEPEDIVDFSSISNEKIAEEYKNNPSEFIVPEKRRIQQLVLTSEKEKKRVSDLLKKGKPFADIVAATGKNLVDTDLGEIKRTDIFDQKIAEAAFSVKPGSPSGLISGAFGFTVVNVTQITPEKIIPLEDVQEAIRHRLALSEAKEKLPAMHDQYEKLRADGNSMKKAASMAGLKMVVLDSVDRFGFNDQRKALFKADFLPQLLQAAFRTEPGVENLPIHLDSGYLFYEVFAVSPAKKRRFEEVKELVLKDWQEFQRLSDLKKKAYEIRELLQKGSDMAKIAQEMKLEKKEETQLKRFEASEKLGLEEAYISHFFSVPPHYIGAFPLKNKDKWIIFKVIDSQNNPIKSEDEKYLIESTKELISKNIKDDFLEIFFLGVRKKFPVRINYELLNQIVSFPG